MSVTLPRYPPQFFDPAYPLPALIANNYGEVMSIPLYDAALMSGGADSDACCDHIRFTAHYTLLKMGELMDR